MMWVPRYRKWLIHYCINTSTQPGYEVVLQATQFKGCSLLDYRYCMGALIIKASIQYHTL